MNSLTFLGVARANRLLRKYAHLKNHVFIDKVLEEIGLVLDISGLENIPKTGPVTLAANHPGGADIMATISAIGKIRPDFVILANELICVEPVADIVLPVRMITPGEKVDLNKINVAYEENKLVVFYAAGMNSRFNEKGELRDRKWRTSYLDFSIKHNAPVVLLNIGGKNSPTFYRVSNIRQKYRWLRNVPLENIFQLRELLNSAGNLKMRFSKPIPVDFIRNYLSTGGAKAKRDLAEKMRAFVYEMNDDNQQFNAKV